MPGLIPGTYTIQVSASGFAPKSVTGVLIDVESRQSADFTLAVGPASEQVTATRRRKLADDLEPHVACLREWVRTDERNPDYVWLNRRDTPLRSSSLRKCLLGQYLGNWVPCWRRFWDHLSRCRKYSFVGEGSLQTRLLGLGAKPPGFDRQMDVPLAAYTLVTPHSRLLIYHDRSQRTR